MRKLLIPLITLLIGLGLGYQFGNFGHKIKDGVHQTYGADIDRKDIRAVLSDQAAAWNRGDISAFMEGYWQSEDLQFASGGRANDAPSGLFTLHFKNVNETWVIVSDHTSSGD